MTTEDAPGDNFYVEKDPSYKKVTAFVTIDNSQPVHFGQFNIRESHAIKIADWCKENNCGRRRAFNQWTFKSEEEYLMFYLRWNGVKVE